MWIILVLLAIYWVLAMVFGDSLADQIWMSLVAGLVFSFMFFILISVLHAMGVPLSYELVFGGIGGCMIAGHVVMHHKYKQHRP